MHPKVALDCGMRVRVRVRERVRVSLDEYALDLSVFLRRTSMARV